MRDQKGRIVEFKNFDLVSVKLENVGITVKYYNLMNCQREITEKVSVEVHPDLINSMDDLKLYFLQKIGYLEGTDFARNALSIANIKELEGARELHDLILSRCSIKGISVSGDTEEEEAVNIKGYVGFPDGGGSVLASGKIILDNDLLGYEEEVKEVYGKIKKEVYCCLFQQKKAQQDLINQIEFDPIEEEE